MKAVRKKASCLLLAMVMAFTMAVQVLPISAFAAGYDWDGWWQNCLNAVGIGPVASDYSLSTALYDNAMFDGKFGELSSREELYRVCDKYNSRFRNVLVQLLDGKGALETIWRNNAYYNVKAPVVVKEDQVNKQYRLYNQISEEFVTAANGQYPYVPFTDWNSESDTGDLPATDIDTSSSSVNHFVALSWASFANVVPVPLEVLRASAQALGATCATQMVKNPNGEVVTFWVIYTSRGGAQVYCNGLDYPFVAYYEPEKTAVGNTVINNITQVENKTENNYEGPVNEGTIVDVDNSKKQEVNGDITLITDPHYSQTLIDLSNMVFNQITETGDRITQNIDSINYDMSTSTYTVNTYDYTYNTTNNYYEYNYHTYNVQYTYNYTYITYIGSTAEYQPKEWSLYYELPDGRSSADLTEADVAGLSFQFVDCINYKKSVTDTALRALYHFDGNVDDSSYYGSADSWTWNKGASLTYMESNAFDGCLYLDEREHQFTLTLPANIGSGDFTLQWRYYQNSGANETANSNYVTIGGNRVLGWSGQYLYNGSGTSLANISIGTWQELALVRHKGTLYYYHNGVRIGSVSNSTIYSNIISFYLGTNRAYSMFDELRFVKGALYTSGAAYTPTQVPYDTNAVLVLPDSPTPVIDDYWVIPNVNAKYKYNVFDTTYSPTRVSGTFTSTNTELYWNSSFYVDGSYYQFQNPSYSVATGYCTPTSFEVNGSRSNISWNYAANFSNNVVPFFFARNLRSSAYSLSNYYSSFPSTAKSYTVTALFVDGTTGFATFTVPVYSQVSAYPSTSNSTTSSILTNDVYTISTATSSLSFCFFTTCGHTYANCSGQQAVNGYLYNRTAVIYSDTYFSGLTFYNSSPLVYLDIKEGTEPTTGLEHVTAIYDADELQPNTAAIQTAIPITGYTVGGVRPTFPERGNVWMQVENNRISSVQVYNGRAWEGVNARWWTGKRWIPIYAFDLTTLTDMWDVTGADGSSDVSPPITSDTSFWNWWKDSWTDFTKWIQGAVGGGGGSSGDDDPAPSKPPSGYDDLLPGETPPPEDPDGGGGWSILDLLGALKDGAWAIVKGTVSLAFDGIGGVVGAVTDIGGFFDGMGELQADMQQVGGDWNWTP